MSDQLVFFEHSPVVEVAVGVEFLQLPGLGAVRLVGLHDLWKGTFPKVQEQPALPPTAASSMQGGFHLQIGNASPPLRVWMLNDDENELLQVQSDRLFLNWRKAFGSDRPYPRYQHLKKIYLQVFDQLRDYVERQPVGTFRPHTAVVSYVNRFTLQPGESLKDVFAPLNPEWDSLDVTATEVRQIIPLRIDDSGSQTGLVNTLAGIDISDPTHGYLEVVARVNLERPGTDPIGALDIGHVAAVTSFEQLTTPKMHKRWGKA